MEQLSRDLGVHLARSNIRVNALAIGPIGTREIKAAFERIGPEQTARRFTHMPMGRFDTLEELAGPVSCPQLDPLRQAGYEKVSTGKASAQSAIGPSCWRRSVRHARDPEGVEARPARALVRQLVETAEDLTKRAIDRRVLTRWIGVCALFGFDGDPYGIRTRISAVKGPRPNP